MTPSVERIQRSLARSRRLTLAAAKAARFLNGVAYRRLGHDWVMERNGEASLVRTLAPTIRRFVDVGANVGEWTSIVLQHCAHDVEGILIEPGDVAADRCREQFPQLEVVQAAAGNALDVMEFFEEPNAGGTSSLVVHTPTAKRRMVDVTTIDHLLASRDWATVDVVKIDAEGYDFHVLEGASGLLADGAIGAVQFEYNEMWQAAGSNLHAAVELLTSANYDVLLVARGGLWQFSIEAYREFWHHSNFVAVHPQLRSLVAPLVRGPA